ncbi:MAG: sialidase family protein [Bdellovibrionota bacterium]
MTTIETKPWYSPLQEFFSRSSASKKVESPKAVAPQSMEKVTGFPSGFHVYGITQSTNKNLLIGAGNPVTGEGAVFVKTSEGSWSKHVLPDETAFINRFVELSDGRLIAGGMNVIGRAAILMGSADHKQWKCIDRDLYAYSQIYSIVCLPNGEVIASTGKMITQGKTKPVFFRSKDLGETWELEEFELPITAFHTLWYDHDEKSLYGGTCGDHNPSLYVSKDDGHTWQQLPELPAYKTYKTIALEKVVIKGEKKLLAVMWGYKLDIADRVVRLYVLEGDQWAQLPEVQDSHFIFDFYVDRLGVFYAGSEKGKLLSSDDQGHTWKELAAFDTNIGAQAMHEDDQGTLWIGKDFVTPDHYSLWKVKSQYR